MPSTRDDIYIYIYKDASRVPETWKGWCTRNAEQYMMTYIYIYIYVNIWVSCLVISNIILELYHFNFGTASSSASKIAYIYRSSYIARHFAYTIPFKFQGPLTHLCDLEAGYGGVWAPNFGGAAPGFKPRTSCLRVRSVTITLRGPPLRANIIIIIMLEEYKRKGPHGSVSSGPAECE